MTFSERPCGWRLRRSNSHSVLCLRGIGPGLRLGALAPAVAPCPLTLHGRFSSTFLSSNSAITCPSPGILTDTVGTRKGDGELEFGDHITHPLACRDKVRRVLLFHVVGIAFTHPFLRASASVGPYSTYTFYFVFLITPFNGTSDRPLSFPGAHRLAVNGCLPYGLRGRS